MELIKLKVVEYITEYSFVNTHIISNGPIQLEKSLLAIWMVYILQ